MNIVKVYILIILLLIITIFYYFNLDYSELKYLNRSSISSDISYDICKKVEEDLISKIGYPEGVSFDLMKFSDIPFFNNDIYMINDIVIPIPRKYFFIIAEDNIIPLNSKQDTIYLHLLKNSLNQDVTISESDIINTSNLFIKFYSMLWTDKIISSITEIDSVDENTISKFVDVISQPRIFNSLNFIELKFYTWSWFGGTIKHWKVNFSKDDIQVNIKTIGFDIGNHTHIVL